MKLRLRAPIVLTGCRAICRIGWVLIVFLGIVSCGDDENRKLPEVTTEEVTEITINSARSGGIITSDGGESVTARGVCWSTDPTPKIDDEKTNDGPGGGSFVSELNGLNPNTTYYVRAYATNANGTAYGIAYLFDTKIITITTNNVTEIQDTSAKSGGKVIAISDLTIIERGICWDVSTDPTTSQSKLVNTDVSESFESILTNLTPSTNYYVRAYATTDDFGTYYGDEKTFRTTN